MKININKKIIISIRFESINNHIMSTDLDSDEDHDSTDVVETVILGVSLITLICET